MTQKVVHGADPWGWDTVPRSELVGLACISPHDCDVPGCPGPENKRKLEAFPDLLAALQARGLLEADAARMDPTAWVAADAERLAQGETAQEAARNKRKLEAFDELLTRVQGWMQRGHMKGCYHADFTDFPDARFCQAGCKALRAAIAKARGR